MLSKTSRLWSKCKGNNLIDLPQKGDFAQQTVDSIDVEETSGNFFTSLSTTAH
ncbi:hypothetical protein [Chryseobacterium soli]|uniref:hypothetical protein n=1 Tax=Chryseobacterium soli TaxID=445961 RepID=UPI000A50BEA3|nr:hypothetical protein [Chryseobacterium soli]